jgi:hypothetical protein
VGVAAEIGEHLFGRSEGRLGVGDPIRLAKVLDKGGEGARLVVQSIWA